jgi:hypothetical protein
MEKIKFTLGKFSLPDFFATTVPNATGQFIKSSVVDYDTSTSEVTSTFASYVRTSIYKSSLIVIYATREEGKAFVHANCTFGHDAQRSGRCNSSE